MGQRTKQVGKGNYRRRHKAKTESKQVLKGQQFEQALLKHCVV